MSLTHNVAVNWSTGNRAISNTVSRSNSAADSVEETVPGASTDLEIIYALDVSAAKVIFMVCDRDLTVETNDGTTPDATVSLKAGVPLWWDSTSAYYTNPFGSTDITSLFVTLAAGDDATFQLEVLKDPTP